MANIISVIVPIYNVEKYLSRCIDSILAQTYLNLEIILVNDGSTDNCLVICEQYLKLDDRIKLVNKKNGGLSSARNAGLKIISGDYVSFIDSDDIIDPTMYSAVNDVLINHRPDVITTNFYDYDIDNIRYKIVRNELPYEKLLEVNEIRKYFVKPFYGNFLGIIPSACTKIYRKSFLIDNHLFFDDSLKRTEDYWFNFEVFKRALTVYAMDKAFYHYFKNDTSIMRTFREDDFDNFLFTRAKKLKYKAELGIEINTKKNDEVFIIASNDFILQAIKNNRKDLVFKVLKNIEFRDAYNNIIPDRIHTKIIQILLKFGLTKLTFNVYKVWGTKSK